MTPYSGGSRKLGTGGGGAQRGGRLRQNQVLAVCRGPTERSTGKSPPPLPYHYGSERGGGGGARAGSAPPPKSAPALAHGATAVAEIGNRIVWNYALQSILHLVDL